MAERKRKKNKPYNWKVKKNSNPFTVFFNCFFFTLLRRYGTAYFRCRCETISGVLCETACWEQKTGKNRKVFVWEQKKKLWLIVFFWKYFLFFSFHYFHSRSIRSQKHGILCGKRNEFISSFSVHNWLYTYSFFFYISFPTSIRYS